jgi:hypothetical protein
MSQVVVLRAKPFIMRWLRASVSSADVAPAWRTEALEKSYRPNRPVRGLIDRVAFILK